MPTDSFALEATVKKVTSTAPIKQALVHRLRQHSAIKTACIGGFHEAFAPTKAEMPFLVYQMLYAPIRRAWGSQMYIAGFDIRIYGANPVDAENVDTLVLNELDDAALVIDGQSTLLCQRVADLSAPDIDEEGRKVYMVGGTYEVWTDQPHP